MGDGGSGGDGGAAGAEKVQRVSPRRLLQRVNGPRRHHGSSSDPLERSRERFDFGALGLRIWWDGQNRSQRKQEQPSKKELGLEPSNQIEPGNGCENDDSGL